MTLAGGCGWPQAAAHLSTTGDGLLHKDQVWLKPPGLLHTCMDKLILLRDECVECQEPVLPVVLQSTL